MHGWQLYSGKLKPGGMVEERRVLQRGQFTGSVLVFRVCGRFVGVLGWHLLEWSWD